MTTAQRLRRRLTSRSDVKARSAGRSHNRAMRKEEVARGPRGRVIVIDSITQLAAGDEGAIIVSGSHGGTSSGSVAADWILRAARSGASASERPGALRPLKLVFFNDAGVGKDAAGIAALALLQARGLAAATVAHDSARIGDALDAWLHGVVSHANAAALALGVRVGSSVQAAVERLLR